MIAGSGIGRIGPVGCNVFAISFRNQRLEDQIGRTGQNYDVDPINRVGTKDRRCRNHKFPFNNLQKEKENIPGF